MLVSYSAISTDNQDGCMVAVGYRIFGPASNWLVKPIVQLVQIITSARAIVPSVPVIRTGP